MSKNNILILLLLVVSAAQAQEPAPQGAPVTEAPALPSVSSRLQSPTKRGFNPDMSVNFLGLWRGSNIHSGDAISRSSGERNGFKFQEAEIQIFADVDPYFRANALFSIGQEPSIASIDTTQTPVGVEEEAKFGIEAEEIFLETISLSSFTFKLGKFRTAFGKQNTLHTHVFPFIDAPLMNQYILGEEGLNEVGLSASVLIDAPWFFEATAQLMTNSSETLYNSPSSEDVMGVFQLKNLWDLADSTTLEWSLFGTLGQNSSDLKSYAAGMDLYLKWRPTEGGKYQAFIFAGQFIKGYNPVTSFTVAQNSGEHMAGLATWLQYQFTERWWIQGRAEFSGISDSDSLNVPNKQSLLLGLIPSEFSGFRIQYDRLTAENETDEHAVSFQWNITLGAHPAHSY